MIANPASSTGVIAEPASPSGDIQTPLIPNSGVGGNVTSGGNSGIGGNVTGGGSNAAFPTGGSQTPPVPSFWTSGNLTERGGNRKIGSMGGGIDNGGLDPQLPFSQAFAYAKPVKPSDYGYFCLSVVLCAVAFSMLSYSIKLCGLVTKDEKQVGGADFGLGRSILLLLFVLAVYALYWLSRHTSDVFYYPLGQWSPNFWPLFQAPREFAPAFMLASIAPCLIAIVNFSCVVPTLRSMQSEPLSASRVTGALIGILLSLINLVANIITFRDSLLKGG